MRITGAAVGIAASIIILGSTGCATKKYVRTETDDRRHQDGRARHGARDPDRGRPESSREPRQALTEQGVEIEKVSGTAQDALERAKAAGKLAEGKLLYEVVLNSDKVTSTSRRPSWPTRRSRRSTRSRSSSRPTTRTSTSRSRATPTRAVTRTTTRLWVNSARRRCSATSTWSTASRSTACRSSPTARPLRSPTTTPASIAPRTAASLSWC